MERCRLTASHIHVGIPLPGAVYDEPGTLLLNKGYVISQQSQLDALLSRGIYVDLDSFNTIFRPASGPAPAAVRKFDPFALRATLKIRLNRALRGLLANSETGAVITGLAADVTAYAATDPDAAVAGALIDHEDDSYPVGHSLDVAIFVALTARQLGWTAEHGSTAVCAALTMNLAILDAQLRLNRQVGPLNASQRELIDHHPAQATELLINDGVNDREWLDAVAQHHEKPAGMGYPNHLGSPDECSQLLRLADIFGARIRNRADRKAMPAPQVIRTLFAEEAKGPHAMIANALVKAIGIVPPGSFVTLANRETGVVFRRGDNASTPSVAVVTHSSGTPIMQPVRRETQRKEFAIAGLLTGDKVNVGYDLGRLWITDMKS